MYNIFAICLSLIEIGVLLLILLKFDKERIHEDEFVISNTVLNNVMNNYYESILVFKIEELKKNYDLDPSSKTNSIKPFTENYNIMLKDCSKEIITSYLSKNCLSVLLKYYSVESLVLIIISNLKKR